MPEKINLNISKSAFEFWTGFNNYEEDNKAKALCYWAGKKAYLDMNRTLMFKDGIEIQTREDLRNDAIKIMYNAFEKIEDDFDRWHENLCDAIISRYREKDCLGKRNNKTQSEDMTIGHAQKWINMTIKYIWLVYSVSSDDLNCYKNLMDKSKDFHVPLDSIILKYIHTEKIIKDVLINNHTWSTINDYTKYADYQKELKNEIKCDPLEWELVHWIKAVNKDKKNKDSDVYSKW